MVDKFVMTDEAVENYGEEFRGVVLTVTHKADKYMPSSEFFAKGRPQGYHPGYDGNGAYLYDLRRGDIGDDLPFSLYAWELTRA